MSFLIGADPELFLSRNGKFISVEDCNGPLIPGTKLNPHKVKGGAIQVDGVAAEFNIDPAKNVTDFIGNILEVVSDLKGRIREHDPSIKLVATPTATFDEDYFFKLPKKTLELGCDPDFCVYKGGKANPRPHTDKPFRTGSGHIHLGWGEGFDPTDEGHLEDCMMVVKELDKFLFPLSSFWDKDKERRTLYGAMGSFRPKSFGVEYRPLSNKWVESHETASIVFRVANAVLRSLDSGKHDFSIEVKKGRTLKESVQRTMYALSA